MTVALRAAGVIVHGTTSAAPSYPAGIAAGDFVCLGAAWKDETATAPTLAGWSKMVDQVVGTGVDGAATGQQRIVVYCKDTVAGGETGTVTVTPSGSANVVSAAIIAWSKTDSAWDVAYDYGTDATAGANLSVPSQATIPQAAGDLIAVFAAHTANTNMGSSTVATTGVTYGTAVEHVDAGTTNGNDQRIAWVSRPVSSGTPSGVTTFTSTITGTTNGGAAFVRLREVAGGGTNYTSNPADPVGATDSATVDASTVRSSGDPAGITDQAATVTAAARSAADPVGVTDTVTASISRSVTLTDSIGATDAATVTAGRAASINDGVSVTDSTAASSSGGGESNPAAPVEVTDQAAATLSSHRSTTEPLSVADSAATTSTVEAAPADPVTVGDEVAAVLSRVVTVSDFLALTASAGPELAPEGPTVDVTVVSVREVSRAVVVALVARPFTVAEAPARNVTTTSRQRAVTVIENTRIVHVEEVPT